MSCTQKIYKTKIDENYSVHSRQPWIEIVIIELETLAMLY